MFYYPRKIFSALIIKAGLLLMLLLAFVPGANAQNAVKTGITGVVSDDRGPIPGVTINILETRQIVISGSNGEYTIPVKPGEYTLQFKFVGLKTITRKALVGPQAMQRLIITMGTDSHMLGTVNVSATRKATTQKALLELRRSSTNIQDAIGAVQ